MFSIDGASQKTWAHKKASIHAGLRNSTVSPKAIVENKNVLKIIFGKAFWEESVFGRM